MDIYVGNLPYGAGDAELRELFATYGNVTSARVVMDKFTGQSRGFGFIEMPTASEAQAAIQGTNGVDFMGRALRVNESQPRPRDDNRGGGSGGRGRNDRNDRGGDRARW